LVISCSCTTQNFAVILLCKQKLILDTSITHEPKIQDTILRPVLVHTLEYPYKWEKGVPVKVQSRCLDAIL
jgi:hypothetical protein